MYYRAPPMSRYSDMVGLRISPGSTLLAGITLRIRQPGDLAVPTPGVRSEAPGAGGLRPRRALCPRRGGRAGAEPRATQGTGPLESSMGNPPPMPPVPKSVLSTLSVRG